MWSYGHNGHMVMILLDGLWSYRKKVLQKLEESMTKEAVKLSIDSEVLEKAKQQIPNLSQFFENCLKAYLGTHINSVFYTSNAQETLNTIKDAQTALYLMTERNNVEDNIKKAEAHEINLAWRRLYTHYRDTRTINKNYLEHAVEVLGVPEVELTDIVEVCFVFSRNDGVDVTEWSEVYAQYGGDD